MTTKAKRGPWKPDRFRCDSCDDIVWSHTPGHWNCCQCWKDSEGKTGFYVDQTRWYCRFGGGPCTQVDEKGAVVEKIRVVVMCWEDVEEVRLFDSEEVAYGFCEGVSYKGSGYSGYIEGSGEIEELKDFSPAMYAAIKGELS